MKVRSDFVTNSSSSSFILGFTNEESVANELLNGFNKWHQGLYFSQVYTDVSTADRLSKDEAMEMIRDGLEWSAMFAAAKKNNIDPWRNWGWQRTEEGKEQIQKELNSMMSKYEDDLDKYPVLISVEYSDHENSELEHEIMPFHGSCIATLNNH